MQKYFTAYIQFRNVTGAVLEHLAISYKNTLNATQLRFAVLTYNLLPIEFNSSAGREKVNNWKLRLPPVNQRMDAFFLLS